jgi:hypothetical protein
MEYDLLYRTIKAYSGEPAAIRQGPSVSPVIIPIVAQQKAAAPSGPILPLSPGRSPNRASLLEQRGCPIRRQFGRTIRLRQRESVTAISLDPIASLQQIGGGATTQSCP